VPGSVYSRDHLKLACPPASIDRTHSRKYTWAHQIESTQVLKQREPAKAGSLSAERAGLDTPQFRKYLTSIVLTAKALAVKELEQSSCYLLVLSVSGHLGDDSGQKLDKSESPPNEGERPSRSPSEGKDTPEALPIPGQSRRRRRQLEKAESDAEEIGRLVAEAHLLLPMSKAKLRGLIYARYLSDLQHSVVDQVRELLEFAVANGIFVRLDLIFWDSGITGRKKNRPGLNAAKAALASDQADVWLVSTPAGSSDAAMQCSSVFAPSFQSHEGKILDSGCCSQQTLAACCESPTVTGRRLTQTWLCSFLK